MNIKKLPKSIIVLALFFFSGIFQLIPIYLLKYDVNNLAASEKFIATSVADIILFIILIIIYYKDLKEDLKKLKGNLYKNLDVGFKYWLIGIVVMVTSNIIINLFIRQANAGNEELVQEMIKSAGLISILTVGLIGPVIEELVFRKAFKDTFTNKYLFIIISGLVFGGLHVILTLTSMWDLLYLIPYCSLGIAFGVIYVKTENIYTSIFMHIFHNTVFTIVSVISAGVILW